MKFKLISDYDSIDKIKWGSFVENHPKGNIFQTPSIYETYRLSKKFYPLVIVVLNESDEIVGLQVSVVKKLFNNILGYFTAQSIVHGGPLIVNNDKEVLNLILKEYNRKISGKAIYSQFRNMWNCEDMKEIFETNKIMFEEHLDILFDLNKGEELLFQEMKRDRRKGINQANKKDI